MVNLVLTVELAILHTMYITGFKYHGKVMENLEKSDIMEKSLKSHGI